jgi:hypothetical protein
MGLFGWDLKHVVFLGLPGCGKTVIVSTVIDRYLRKRPRLAKVTENAPTGLLDPDAIPEWIPSWTEHLLLKLDPLTLPIVNTTTARLRSGEWPDRSVGLTTYHVTAQIGRPIFSKQVPLQLFDYSGEALSAFMGFIDDQANAKSCDPPLEDSLLKASAVCLVIDPDSLLPGGVNSDQRVSRLQQSLMKALNSTAAQSVAVIFSKWDLCQGLLREQGRSGGAQCPELDLLAVSMAPLLPFLEERKHAYFSVCCVPSDVHIRTGQHVPSPRWESGNALGVDEFVWWLVENAL